MLTRIRLTVMLFISLAIFVLAFSEPFLPEPQAIAENTETYGPSEHETVFGAVVNSFDLLAALMQDVSYNQSSVYPTVNKANSIEGVVHYLEAGFQPEIASNIANYYFGWDEEAARLVLIPTDSIPMITESDRDKVQITFINDHQAVVQRTYENCYGEQNRCLYSVYVSKLESGWKISELSLEDIEHASQ